MKRYLVPLTIAVLFNFNIPVSAADPAWWATRGVVNASPASNLSPATIGQAKHMAAMALAELQFQLAPADYSALQSQVAAIVNFTTPQTQAEFDNQRMVLLTGQLKAHAKPFYDKLRTLDAAWVDNEMVSANIRVVEPGSNPISYSPYPWSVATSDDQNKAVANLGQLKAVFSLRLETFRDSDHDGLPDAWERLYFPNLDQTPGGDPDGDGLTNARELELGFNPAISDATVDADADGLSNVQEVAIGSDAADPDTDGDQMGDGYEVWHTFSPLVVETNNKGPGGDFDNDGTTNANEALTGRVANLFHESFPPPSPGTGMIAKWYGSTGFWYTIQYSTNLVTWTTHPMGFMGTNMELTVDVANWYGAPLPSALFVRLYIGPAATADMEGDGLGAELEFQLGLDPTKADTDGDGISDADEDTDGDGLSNAAELAAFTSPALADTDGDGLSDWKELNQTASNPASAVDSDSDGIPDDWEKWWATQILASGVALTELELAGLLAGNVEPNREAFGDGTNNAEQFDVARIAAAKSGHSASAYTIRGKRRAVWGAEMAHEGGTFGGISGLLNGDVRWIGSPSVEPYMPPAGWVTPYPQEIDWELSSRAPWEELPWVGYDIIQMYTEAHYQQNSYENGYTETEFLHENHQFKLVFPEISDEARSVKFLKVTATWGYPVAGTVPIQTAEMVEFVIPENRTTSPQIVEINPGLVDGKDVNVSLLPVDLDFIKPGTEKDFTPEEIAEAKEDSEGEVVGVNWDDDNNSEGAGGHGKLVFKNDFDDANGTTGEDDLIQLKLHKPAIEGAKARLRYDNAFVKIWLKPDRKDEVKSEDTEIDLTEDKIVYLEGCKITEAEEPKNIEMQIKVGPNGTYGQSDSVKVHVGTPIISFGGKHEWTGGAASRNLADQLRDKQYLGARRRDDRNNTIILNGKNQQGKTLWYSVDMVDLVPYTTGDPTTNKPLVKVRAPALDKEMKMALGLAGAHIIYGGHSNFGLGPNFNSDPTSLDDYMNISGRGMTTIDYEELVGAHGDPNVTLRTTDYVAEATNSEVAGVGQLKFSGPSNGAVLTKKNGTPIPGHPYHFTRPSTDNPSVTNYEVIVNSSGDLPTLRHKSCFMASCNTGRHYYETLNHGTLFYSMNLTVGTIGPEGEIAGDLLTFPGPYNQSMESDTELGSSWSVTHYVRLLTEGKSWDAIVGFFNDQQTLDHNGNKIEGLYRHN